MAETSISYSALSFIGVAVKKKAERKSPATFGETSSSS